MKEELLEQLKTLTEKKISLINLCQKLELNEYEVLTLVRELKNQGINVIVKKLDDNIYLFNQGETELTNDKKLKIYTDDANEFKFVAISDTRFGSKSQQLSILNDIYKKAYELGYKNFIHCGNISEGLYSMKSIYSEENFLDDTLSQIEYIANNYPKIEGTKTYFITGFKDETHLKYNKINIGKRIQKLRDDMIYLGYNSSSIEIDKVKMLIFNPKLEKTYTVSYRAQQQIDSFRSEDKPNILLYGGLLQVEKFNYRNIDCISVPSVCATTKEMNDKRYSNTIGAWYITIKTNNKGYLESIKAIDSIYYNTNKKDYETNKVLKLKKEDK